MTAKITDADERAADAIIDWWCADGRLHRLAPAELVPRIAQAIADAREAATIAERVACVEWVRDAEGDGVANDLVAARMVR